MIHLDHDCCTELAASVPRSEIVGKSEYFRFGMRDSLAVEASFLQVTSSVVAVGWFLPMITTYMI